MFLKYVHLSFLNLHGMFVHSKTTKLYTLDPGAMKQLSVGRGTPGCKNIRLGGDTINPVPFGEEPGAHMVYMVYRSFKFKPKWNVQI